MQAFGGRGRLKGITVSQHQVPHRSLTWRLPDSALIIHWYVGFFVKKI
jgi:hypothetical protein